MLYLVTSTGGLCLYHKAEWWFQPITTCWLSHLLKWHHSWSKWADKMYHILPRWQVDFTVFNCTGPPSQQPFKHFQHVTEEVFSPVQSSPSCCAHKQTHTRGFNTFCTLAVGESLYKYHQILLADFWGHMSNHMRISQDLHDLIEVARRKWQSGRLKATERLLSI